MNLRETGQGIEYARLGVAGADARAIELEDARVVPTEGSEVRHDSLLPLEGMEDIAWFLWEGIEGRLHRRADDDSVVRHGATRFVRERVGSSQRSDIDGDVARFGMSRR